MSVCNVFMGKKSAKSVRKLLNIVLKSHLHVCVCVRETRELMAAGSGYLWLSSRSTSASV